MQMDRRQFLQRSALAAGALGLAATGPAGAQEPAPQAQETGARPLAVSTWEFGKPANERALTVLEQGGTVLDAVEQGVRLVEESGEQSTVGRGGSTNAEGVVQLDACIMGPDRRAGSVAALEGFPSAISVARRVMEQTRHVMLVGEGARQFALAQGFDSVQLATEERRKAWERWKERGRQGGDQHTHDTLALLGLDAEGRPAGGCSTSGWAYKLPGRVGDAPIIGGGLYVDGQVGAAGATGLGEDIMRYCGSFLVVELMRQGMTPQQACEAAVARIGAGESWKQRLSINFVALDTQGRYGAAGTQDRFVCAVAGGGSSRVEKAVVVRSPGG